MDDDEEEEDKDKEEEDIVKVLDSPHKQLQQQQNGIIKLDSIISD